MGFIMADADRELTFSSFSTINHRQTIQNRISRVVNLVKCAGRMARKQNGAKDQEREIKKEKERVRQKDWLGWRNKSLLYRISIPAVIAVNHNQGAKEWKIKEGVEFH